VRVLALCISEYLVSDSTGASRQLTAIVAGIAAVLGHNYTCWLKFKGGKGIATTAGVYLALAPLAFGVAFCVLVLFVVATRFVSVGSIMAAVALSATVWLADGNNVLLGIVTTVLAILAILKHKANIQRLLHGTESRISFKSKGTAT